MEESFALILGLATILCIATTGITEAVKRALNVPTNLVPVVGIIVGTLLGLFANFTGVELVARLWAGAIAGLMATGLYENLIDRTKKK